MRTKTPKYSRFLSLFLALLMVVAVFPATHATASDCGISGCSCTGSCSWKYTYSSLGSSQHRRYLECTGCGWQSFLYDDLSHNMSGGVCSDCGYSDGSGGGSGDSGGSTCYHTYTYKNYWNCTWDEYCEDCGAYLGSGESHSYSYGSWQYYSSSQHRRTAKCSDCGDSSYSYGSHYTTRKYTQYNASQHQYGRYCSACSSYVGSVSYLDHSFTYGAWTSYSASQHRRTASCSTCGYSKYEYANHSLTYGNWTVSEGANYSSRHERTVSCSCGYSTTEYEAHKLYGVSDYKYLDDTRHMRKEECACGYPCEVYSAHSYSTTKESVSDSQHNVIKTCSLCGHFTTVSEAHSFAYGEWSEYSETQHKRAVSCSCGYSATEYADHADMDGNGECDACGYLMARFSVTVPSSLTLAVSEHGEVFCAEDIAIVNNSTAAVRVSGVTANTVNGWTLVPYETNMAATKVDAQQIGLYINGAVTLATGTTEALVLGTEWTIEKGEELPIICDAVVSAYSEPVSEQVLTLVFVLNWA